MAAADPSPAAGAGLPATSEPRLAPMGEGGAGAGIAGAPLAASGLQARLRAFADQPAVRRAMPAIVGLSSVVLLAAIYLAIAEPPRRLLFSGLGDLERGQVVETLAAGGIDYRVDPQTGAISVAEDDYYAASSMVASNGALPAPQGANEMLDSIPLGSSRTLEGERLRLARERELMLTIKEIHGISGVRVHLATPERSVFVRENDAPSASVMLTLARGRSLSRAQVDAIVNLVAGSVPGMSPDAVRVVDQNGRLLSAPESEDHDALALQREFEAKLREQVSSLLAPLLGAGNFSSQVQVELDHSEVTSARESYDDEGVVRSESERSATRTGGQGVGGVPGVDANTPPPDAELVDGAPQGDAAAADPEPRPAPTDTESAVQRNYELGREVAVTSVRPGALRKLSVAVAVSNEALVAAAPMTAEQLESLVAAAVGADTARGDKVAVVVGGFESIEPPEPQFWEQPWFMPALRYGTALIAVLLVLVFVVRPLMKRARGQGGDEGAGGESQDAAAIPAPAAGAGEEPEDLADLPDQVRLARQLAASRPERAVAALQRMIEAPGEGGESGEARAT